MSKYLYLLFKINNLNSFFLDSKSPAWGANFSLKYLPKTADFSRFFFFYLTLLAEKSPYWSDIGHFFGHFLVTSDLEQYKTYLIEQSGWYYFRRKVPAEYRHVDPRKWVKFALKTQDRAEAKVRAHAANLRINAYWIALVESNSTHSGTKYKAAMDLASIFGLAYRPFAEIMKLPDDELIERGARLNEEGAENPANFQAIFGTADQPKIMVSELLPSYEKLAKQELQGKSDDQLRVWRNPRKRAIRNWIRVNNDAAIDDIDPHQALEFRDWWLDRVETDGLRPDSANKDINHLSRMCRELCQFHRLAYADPFNGTRLKEGPEPDRFPFSREFVQHRLLAPGALSTLNEEARAIVFTLASTGARPVEIATLLNNHIILDHDVPYIRIMPTDERQLKTRHSKREVPLCGSALVGAQMLKEISRRRYFDAPNALSAVINKYLTEHGLRETSNHTLYGLRHTFQDGLEALEVTDRMQTELFGHKYNRPTYGNGPTLEHKQQVMKKLAFELS